MRMPTSSSKWAALKRRYRMNHKGPKPLYLFRFPEDRLRGWLCDGNGNGWQANH